MHVQYWLLCFVPLFAVLNIVRHILSVSLFCICTKRYALQSPIGEISFLCWWICHVCCFTDGYIYIYIYIHICVCVCVYVCIYMHVYICYVVYNFNYMYIYRVHTKKWCGGASFLNRARNSRCTVITDLDTSKRNTQKAFSCSDAILETGPAAPQ